jgi:protein involved in polysaccharide export with SLBB domain
MSLPEQDVAARVAQPVPAAVPIAGHTQAPPEQKLEPRQAVVLLTTLQAGVLLSGPQVATVEGFMQ